MGNWSLYTFMGLEKEKMKKMLNLDLQNEILIIQKQISIILLTDIDISVNYIITKIGITILEILKFIVAYHKGLILCMIQ